jgi:hypothetical protein
MTQDRWPGTNELRATLAVLGVFGVGLLLLMLWQVGNAADADVKHWGVYAIFAGAFIEVAVIARAIVLKAGRNLPKRAR